MFSGPDVCVSFIQKRTKVFLKFIWLYCQFHLFRDSSATKDSPLMFLRLQFAFKIESASNMTIFQTSGLERHPSGKSTVLLIGDVFLGGDSMNTFRVFG